MAVNHEFDTDGFCTICDESREYAERLAAEFENITPEARAALDAQFDAWLESVNKRA